MTVLPTMNIVYFFSAFGTLIVKTHYVREHFDTFSEHIIKIFCLKALEQS